MRFVLVGNYGVGNLGDEVLREYFPTEFLNVHWVVVSASSTRSNEVPRLPFGIRSVFRPWWKTTAAIARSDGIVFGGGSLFTDVESAKAPMMWWMYAVLARLFRKKIILAFQGIGPFRTSVGEWCAKWVTERSVHISVRDDASLERMRQWKLHIEPVRTFDPAIIVFSQKKANPAGRRLVLIPRHNSSDGFIAAASACLADGWDFVDIVLLQRGDAETRFIERLRSIASRSTVRMHTPSTADELLDVLSTASKILTERFHGALAALAMEIPYEVVVQHAGDKLSSLPDVADRAMLFSRVEEGRKGLASVLGSDLSGEA